MNNINKSSHELELELDKDKAIEFPLPGFGIETAVKKLIEFRESGRNVYIDFNGIKLYSADVTMEKAYKKITGMSQKKYKELTRISIQKNIIEQEINLKVAETKIEGWIEMGKTLGIEENLMKDWETTVHNCVKSMYQGRELENAIAILEKLNSDATTEAAKEVLKKQDNSGNSLAIVRGIVSYFSQKGKDFFIEIDNQ